MVAAQTGRRNNRLIDACESAGEACGIVNVTGDGGGCVDRSAGDVECRIYGEAQRGVVSVRRATLALFGQEAHYLMPACFGIGAYLFEDGL